MADELIDFLFAFFAATDRPRSFAGVIILGSIIIAVSFLIVAYIIAKYF